MKIKKLKPKIENVPTLKSKAFMQIARREMKELEKASDRGFLIRLKMDRKLVSI